MDDKIRATVGILTFNSAKTLERALASVQRFENILICDGGSTDETLAIAAWFGARVIPQREDGTSGPLKDFSEVRNRCVAEAKYDWFLYIDSDETAEPDLIDEIAEIVETNPDVDGFRLSPRIIFQGKRIEYSSNYPAYQFRFFKRKPGTCFDRPIHERIVFPPNAVLKTLKGHWNYYVAGPQDVYDDLKRDMVKFTKRYEGKPFSHKLIALKNIVRTMISITLKSIWEHAFHHRESYPIRMEWMRVVYQWHAFRAIFGKRI